MARSSLIFILCFAVCSCGTPVKREIPKPNFATDYDDVVPALVSSAERVKFELVTLSAIDMPLNEFSRAVAEQTGLSIITELAIDSAKVTAHVVEQPVDVVLTSVARRLGVQVVNRGRLFYIGSLKPEDRGQLVRRMTRLDKSQLGDAAKLMLSDVGRAWTAPDGLMVISDRVEILARIDDMLNSIEASQPGTWVCQFYLLSLSDQSQREIGFDVNQSVAVGASYVRGSLSGAPIGLRRNLNANFSALLSAAVGSSGSRIVAQPMFLLQDGQTARIQEGEVVPVPRRTVGETGVVSVTGYERIETGLVMSTNLRQQGQDDAQLSLDLTISQVTGFVGEAPITQQSTFVTIASVSRNGTFLIGQILRDKASKVTTGTVIPTKFKWDEGSSVLQIWARVYCVK